MLSISKHDNFLIFAPFLMELILLKVNLFFFEVSIRKHFLINLLVKLNFLAFSHFAKLMSTYVPVAYLYEDVFCF